MGKFYTEDGEEIEAFTQKEVDAKVGEATKSAEEAKTALEEKTAEYDKLSKRYEDKNTSYSELLKKNKEYEEAEKTRSEDIEKTYSKSIDEQVKKLAGDDKEYAKVLKELLERDGIKEVTNDSEKIANQIKEAKALANAKLDREPNANPVDGGGNPPASTNNQTDFTETTEGKSTYEALAGMMGVPAEETNDK